MGSRRIERLYLPPSVLGVSAFDLSTLTDLSSLNNGALVEPTSANTGLSVQGVDPGDLQVITGSGGVLTIDDAFIAANPAGLDRKWFKCFVDFTGSTPYTITNSRGTGPDSFTATAPAREALFRARSTSKPLSARLYLTNVESYPTQPDVNVTNVAGERMGTQESVNHWGGSDIIDFWNPCPMYVYRSKLGPFTVWGNDSKHSADSRFPGRSHNDLCQSSGCSEGELAYNAFYCYAHPTLGQPTELTAGGYPQLNWGTCVALTPGNHITGVDVHHNWFRGSECSLFLSWQNGSNDFGNGVSLHDNQFDTNQHGYGPYGSPARYSRQIIRYHDIEITSGGYFTTSNNTFIDDDTVISAYRGQPLPAFGTTGTGAAGAQHICSINTIDQSGTAG